MPLNTTHTPPDSQVSTFYVLTAHRTPRQDSTPRAKRHAYPPQTPRAALDAATKAANTPTPTDKLPPPAEKRAPSRKIGKGW